MFGLKYKVERPQAGQALISVIGPDGTVLETHLETDAAKADAMTSALEAAPGGSKLGVEIGPNQP